MAWESSIDRLIQQQVHLAERGDLRPQQVEPLLADLCALDPTRAQSAFHLGYAKVLLGLTVAEPVLGSRAHRWFMFGVLRAHDRRGERHWVAELIQDPACLIDLLGEPGIAAQCLPVVMRSLFGCGDLKLAMNAIEYLATSTDSDDANLLLDASLTDLLSRLETMVRARESDTVGPILRRCVQLEAFRALPADVRARYFRALGEHHLHCGEFDAAGAELSAAFDLTAQQARLRSSVCALAGLAALRLHGFDELEVQQKRGGRDEAATWFGRGIEDVEQAVPEAWYGAGIVTYEAGDLDGAVELLDHAMKSSRRSGGRDDQLLDRCRFYLAAALLTKRDAEEANRALRLIEQALNTVVPDLDTFYPVHEELKKLDRRVALRFLDSVDVARGTAPDQILIVALEYLGLGEAEPAAAAARRVLAVAVDLDQRVEAMRVLLTCCNMQGDRDGARATFEEIRDLLVQRGAFTELEGLLRNEEFVGQALDHLEIKCELVALYEEMDDREIEKATLQSAIARSLRARKDVASMQEALGILREVETRFPDLVRDDIGALTKLLAVNDSEPVDVDGGAAVARRLAERLGRPPRVLVAGGNERQRRHHPRFFELAEAWGFDGEWLMANYSSPQKLVASIDEQLTSGIDLLLLLHWNRHETTEPALELAREA
ncbi:MAG: tetratricopeptide repeat protein, partial [Planctomycetes bacterium]|nr:tetratricopeptide repeat protein [Planctomycetota bacterium]